VGFGGTVFGAAATLLILGGLRSRSPRSRSQRSRWPMVICRAETATGNGGDAPEEVEPIVQGGIDLETGEANYVNPWDERFEKPDGTWQMTQRFYEYEGPVYKKVPIVSGISFPLDPKLYKGPLEPPPPGKKWGDGRSQDGNWYAEVEGEKLQYWQGWGRRKTACAVVKLFKGTGQFTVNGRDANDFFENYCIWWVKACEPLAALGVKNDYDMLCKAWGSGKSGKAGAIRLAAARAMQEMDFNKWHPLLKKAKYLARDWRKVESKKTGKPKARKSTPYNKR